jgi:hypothetical protein
MSLTWELAGRIGPVYVDALRAKPFWLLVFVIGYLYYRMTLDPAEAGFLTLYSLAAGIGGGLAGSGLLILLGIAVNQGVCLWLFGIAGLLMLIRRRFFCFSYAGGLLSVISLIFGLPGMEVPQVMGLVAVLHLVEALLIWLTGAYRPMASYGWDAEGRLTQGVELRKIWPIPLVMLMAGYVAPQTDMAGVVEMPFWWPLIPQKAGMELAGLGGEWVYSMMTAVAVLGYGDLVIAGDPGVQTRKVCIRLMGYSIILLLLCVWAGHVSALGWLPALFGPVAHDVLMGGDRGR